MSWLPYVVAYVAIGVFVVAVVARFLMWKRMPMHLRWELYPVPHEGKRAEYGGSYLEEVDWWKKPREQDKVAELNAMATEIFFLVALREHNKKLWWRSFPFHFGIYLVIAATFGMIGACLLVLILPGLMRGGFGTLKWLGERFPVTVVPFEVVTYRLRMAGGQWLASRCDMIEREL